MVQKKLSLCTSSYYKISFLCMPKVNSAFVLTCSLCVTLLCAEKSVCGMLFKEGDKSERKGKY